MKVVILISRILLARDSSFLDSISSIPLWLLRHRRKAHWLRNL
jgi:hypothetical protein